MDVIRTPSCVRQSTVSKHHPLVTDTHPDFEQMWVLHNVWQTKGQFLYLLLCLKTLLRWKVINKTVLAVGTHTKYRDDTLWLRDGACMSNKLCIEGWKSQSTLTGLATSSCTSCFPNTFSVPNTSGGKGDPLWCYISAGASGKPDFLTIINMQLRWFITSKFQHM